MPEYVPGKDPAVDAAFARMREAREAAATWPAQFLAAWKEGVALAGPRYFTRGSAADSSVESKWDYYPHEGAITNGFGVLSGGEKRFLAAMVSFYNAEWGQKLCKRAAAPNICDLSAGLDFQRRNIIARLFQTYGGW